MKLQEHHIKWLEQNDGDYEIVPCRMRWVDADGNEKQNKIRMSFRSTAFSFLPNGLAEGIEQIIKLYPDSLKD